MTEEEINTAIENAVEAATTGLKANNVKLQNEVKDLKAAKTTAEQAAETAKDDVLRKAGDITTLEANLKTKHEAAIKALETERDNLIKERDSEKIETALNKAFVDNNVDPKLHKPMAAMYRSDATVVDGKVVIENTDASAKLKAYFESDEGKAYVVAPRNSGAGAVGARDVSASEWTKRPETPAELEKFGRLSMTDPIQFNALCDRFDMQHMKD